MAMFIEIQGGYGSGREVPIGDDSLREKGRPFVDVAIMTQPKILFSEAMACRVFLVFKGSQGRLCGMFPYLFEPCGGFLQGDEPSRPRPETRPFRRHTRTRATHCCEGKSGVQTVAF